MKTCSSVEAASVLKASAGARFPSGALSGPAAQHWGIQPSQAAAAAVTTDGEDRTREAG